MIKHRSLLRQEAERLVFATERSRLAPALAASAPALRIATREALINALQQAVQVEHALMVQYLYAAFSFRRSLDEGLTPRQLTAVRDWQRAMLGVARDEMAHLGTVCNMLNAVGGTPSFWRPAFSPEAEQWFPVPFAMQAFGAAALDRFVRFESPEPSLVVGLASIAPPAIEFDYVGQLYRAIREGFATVAAGRGSSLFLGRPDLQDEGDWTGNLPIYPIRSVASAQTAVDFIIAQGEGAPGSEAGSHFATFRRIMDELGQLSAADPGFLPARNVVTNPLTRGNSTATQTLLPGGSLARSVAELFNHLYESVLMLLTVYFDPAGESAAQRALAQAGARRLMSGVLRPLAEELTLLPIPGTDGVCAGAPFEVYGGVRVPSDPRARWQLLAERLDLAAQEARSLANENPALSRCRFVADSLDYLVDNWNASMAEGAT